MELTSFGATFFDDGLVPFTDQITMTSGPLSGQSFLIINVGIDTLDIQHFGNPDFFFNGESFDIGGTSYNYFEMKPNTNSSSLNIRAKAVRSWVLAKSKPP